MSNKIYGPKWHGVVIGLLSTLAGLAGAHLFAGLIRDAISPVIAVGGEFIDIVPPWLKDLAIDLFGTNDKIALQVGIFSVLGLIGAGVGVLAQRQNRSAAYTITVVIGVIGAFAVWLRPDPSLVKLIPTIIGSAISVGVLWWLAPRVEVAAAADPNIVDPDVEAPAESQFVAPMPRRSFMQGVSTVGLFTVVAGAIGQLLGKRFSVSDERATLTIPDAVDPANGANAPSSAATATTAPAANGSLVGPIEASNFTVEGVDAPAPTKVLGAVAGERDFGLEHVEAFQVPTPDFYRIDTALSVPQVSVDEWSLRVHGMVDKEMTLTFDDLINRANLERFITLSCVSNEVGGGLVGNALWQGVRLADLLNEAGIQPGATQVISRSVDGWNCGSPTAAIMDGRDAMLAFAMNGEPLPAEHGYPVRLVVPGLYGYVSATKWVTEIELARWEDFDGYWVPRGWSKIGPVKIMARIDRPRVASDLSANGEGLVDIAGLAWAVHRGISKVEISIDGGDWLECELAGVPSDDTWRQWRYRWENAPAGSHTVTARAYDGFGQVQPLGPKAVAPDGAEGYHQVDFTVV